MKILNQPNLTATSYGMQTNFKARSFSPIVKSQLQIAVQNPASKKVFLSLVSVLGLTSIITWVNAFKKGENNADEHSKLDVINKAWVDKNNETLLDSNKSKEYLDLISRSDTSESVLWTKALMQDGIADADSLVGSSINDEAKNLFLDPSTNETFMSVSADKKLKTLFTYLQNLLQSSGELKENALKKIEQVLSSLVKQADKLQTEEETSALYDKFSEIVKMFALQKMMELKDISGSVVAESVTKQNIETSIENPTNLDSEDIEKVEEKNSEEERVLIDVTKYSKKGIWDKKSETTQTVIEEPVKKPIELNDQNRKFVTEILIPEFKNQSLVDIEMYSENIDFIQKIYETLPKEIVKSSFVAMLKTKDINEKLSLYKKLTGGEVANLNFMNFIYLENMKNFNGGSITQEEFNRLNEYHKEYIEFFQAHMSKSPKYSNDYDDSALKIVFANGIDLPVEKRLAIIADFHKIAFNVPEDKLLAGEQLELVETEDIAFEIAKNLQKSSDNYIKIMSYLGLSDDEISDIQTEANSSLSSATELLQEKLQDRRSTQMKNLCEILNNENFKDLMVTTHARMRFLERIVFADGSNITKSAKIIKSNESKALTALRKELQKNDYVKNYSTEKLTGKNPRYGAQICLSRQREKTVLGLDKFGHIHTIY